MTDIYPIPPGEGTSLTDEEAARITDMFRTVGDYRRRSPGSSLYEFLVDAHEQHGVHPLEAMAFRDIWEAAGP